jgi:hypothetical protein
MKQKFAVALAVLGLAACSEPAAPPPDRLTLAPEWALDQEAVPGSAAAELGDLSVPDPTAENGPSIAANGQTVVLPNAYTNVMGEFNNRFPHAQHNMRYQQVFLGAELGTITALGQLCLRRDQVFGGPALTQQLTVKLGPTALNHLTLTPVFDANYAAPPTQVFSGPVQIPFSSGGGTPTDFYICIDFTTPYIHPAGTNLLVEIVNTSTSSTGHFDDACRLNPGCTTRRVWAFSATAAIGFMDAVPTGLVMRFESANPTTKDDCKDGNWENFGFKNQGQCVRFVETGKDDRIGE